MFFADINSSEEFFYQIGLRQFGNIPKIKLEPAPPLRELIKLAVAADPDFSESGMTIDEGADVSLILYCISTDQ
jgi:DNA mismatch repair protein MLH1